MALNTATIQGKHHEQAEAHWKACEVDGLVCPFDVFEQLFHEQHAGESLAADLKSVDWTAVIWEERLFSGVKLRQIAAPRGFQYAVDEARARTLLYGLSDERPEVMTSWQEQGTWLRAPVLVEGDVLGNVYRHELLVGFTRLGDLLGMLDREEVPEHATHRVWVGGRKRSQDVIDAPARQTSS
jgi:hypothetical protein